MLTGRGCLLQKERFTMEGKKVKKTAGIVAAVIVVVILLSALLGCFTVVEAGHTGVLLTFGSVSGKVLNEGLNFKVPYIQTVIQIDNRVQKAEVACSSASKDLQTVSSTVALNYRVRSTASADIYRNVGLDYENIIISPAIQECVKAVSARYTAEELITQRQTISDQMAELLSEKINPYGLDIDIFNIISLDFTDEFNAAIEAKQTAQQNALKAEQDLARIKVEAQQTIEQAQAEAEAYRLKSEQITPQMIAMEYIDKWDGHLPTVATGDTAMMFDLSQLMEEASQNGSAQSSPAPAAPAVTQERNAPSAETVTETEDEAVTE